MIGGVWVDPQRGYFRPNSTNPGLVWRLQDLIISFLTFFAMVFPMPEEQNAGARVYKSVQSLRLLKGVSAALADDACAAVAASRRAYDEMMRLRHQIGTDAPQDGGP